MATPLYKRMRTKGTTFYAFPNAIKDFSLANFQDDIKITPSKFVLLNIPTSYTGTTEMPGVLDFVKVTDPENFGTKLYSFDPDGPRSNYEYSESLVESLRNYIANADTLFRESKISLKKEFYNPSENKTPTEMLFWKWCRKMNILDLEPGSHGIDWDKNLTDFENPNASSFTNRDYFRKYLWKEREIILYECDIAGGGVGVDTTITISNEVAKFKTGDKLVFSGTTSFSTGVTYLVTGVVVTETETTITIDLESSETDSGYCKLSYHKLVQYIGEVQAVSKTQTSENNFTEFTAMIPPHAGMTPTILWYIETNTNYYPGLELPVLAEEKQHEIKGSEYLSSPIRTNPGDYPGSYFAYFDTVDKTYQLSSGDAVRLSGNYFGILRSYNDNLADDDYVERLTEFDSTNIDGTALDFDRKHYLKMNLPDSTVRNFDEFNAMVINEEPPSDFEFNAILWYYDIDDGSGDIETNLYGIEFLNNPDDDFGTDDDRLIATTRKLVTNNSQDGLSYIYNLNIDYKVDNDMLPLRYDPASVYNLFGFDLYNNVMANYGKLNQNFMTIINEFIRINKKVLDIETMLYSQVQLEEIQKRLEAQEELLKLYQTNQFVDSDNIRIEIDYTKNYPAVKFKANVIDYDEIYNFYTTDILNYNILYSSSGTSSIPVFQVAYPTLSSYVGDVERGISFPITVPNVGKTLVNIYSNVVVELTGNTISVVLNRDLSFKQTIDFMIRPDIALYTNNFQINIMFDDGTGTGRKEKQLIGNIDLPIDISEYDIDNPTGSTFNRAYYYDLETYIDSIVTGTTSIVDINEQLFNDDDWVYIDAFYFEKDDELSDYSGLYRIISGSSIQLELDINSTNWGELQGRPRIFYYKGVKISILRIEGTTSSDILHRYLVTKEFLSNKYLQKIDY